MILLAAVLLAIVLCLCAEAFFSGSEIAFTSANRPKILRRAKENDPRAAQAKDLLSQPELLFSTTVVGTTVAMNCATTISTLYILRTYGPSGEWLNVVVLTPIILIFAEFVPKMIARANADQAVLRLARPLMLTSIALYPITRALSLYAQLLKRITGESPEKSFFLSREEIKGALPASRGSDVTASERMLIERILEFSKLTVKDRVRPLIDVVAIEESETLADAVKVFTESGHSRMPVYQERIDRIVGFIQGFDCLRAPDLTKPVRDVMQQAFFVPESKPLEELFLELKNRPMAIVVNEYGGAEGIVTMEDVMEEVVGEIEDEYDEPHRLYHQIGENSFIVNARITMDELEEGLRITLPQDEDYQTLAGFLLKRMQKIPKKWDSTIIDGVEYVVQSATDRSIEEVYIIIHTKKK